MLGGLSPSRLVCKLRSEIGATPAKVGWDRLWSVPVVYICVRAPPFPKAIGPRIYVGQTLSFPRRLREHMSRLSRPHGRTQQPFYSVVRGPVGSDSFLSAAVSEWFFFRFAPLMVA